MAEPLAPPVNFVLCADDFGLSPGVSEGILELASAGRLSAVGCMMTQAGTREAAAALDAHRDRVDIGMHLVLTDLKPLSPGLRRRGGDRLPGNGELARRAVTGALDLSDVRAELTLQLDSFVDIFGRAPDFVDGHHHVHQLPGIRDIVIDLIATRFGPRPPYVRACDERLAVIMRRGVEPLKAFALGLLGGPLRRRARARGIPVNDGFSGIYDLSGRIPYERLFDALTNGLRPGSIVMCHPGRVDDELRTLDRLTNQRDVERRYFLSDAFTALLEVKNLSLGRLSTNAQ